MVKMKNNRFLFFLALVMLMGFQYSCKDMDYTYRQFVEDGETIYVSKADSIVVRGGEKRAEVRWLLLSDPKVTKYKVYWNNRKDSIEGAVQKTEEVDTVKVMLNNLAEGVYEFEIFLFDKSGNTSIKSSKIGKVYGERYQSSLYNRIVRSLKRVNQKEDLEVGWVPADNGMVYSDVKYENADGNEVVSRLKTTDNLITLPNFPLDGDFYIRTAFLPDTLALDTFYVDYEKVEVPRGPIEILLDKSLWKNPGIANSGEYNTTSNNSNATLVKLWDNITDATSAGYFQMHNTSSPDLPNSFGIDLGAKYTLTKLKLHHLAHNTTWAYKQGNPKRFEIYVSNTATANMADWIKIGEFETERPSGLAFPANATTADLAFATAGFDFTFPESEDGYRYFYLRNLESWAGIKSTTVAEITLWGYAAAD